MPNKSNLALFKSCLNLPGSKNRQLGIFGTFGTSQIIFDPAITYGVKIVR